MSNGKDVIIALIVGLIKKTSNEIFEMNFLNVIFSIKFFNKIFKFNLLNEFFLNEIL